LNQISSNAPILILGVIVKPELIGLYFFASQIIGIPVGMFTNAVNQVFFPVFAGRKDNDIIHMSSRFIRLVGFLGLPVLFTFSLIMIFAVSWLFQGKWDDAIPLIWPLFLIFGSSLYCTPLGGIPFIKRKPNWELIWNILSVIIKILAMLIGLIYSFNAAIWLFAIASAVSHFTFYLMAMVLVRQKLMPSLARLLYSLIPTVVLAIITGFVLHMNTLWVITIVLVCNAALFYISDRFSKGLLISDLRFLIKR
jgi:O-antigen/teichoic acid export membrane protein